MTSFRFFLLAVAGVAVGLLQWVVFNVFPVTAVINIGLLICTLLLVRQHVSAALVFGCGVGLIHDIGSYNPFPVFTISFLLCSIIILALFGYFVTHRSYLGYILAGCIMFFGHRLFSSVIVSTYDIGFFSSISRFPHIWLQSAVSLVVYVVIVSILYRRWKVIHVNWPRTG